MWRPICGHFSADDSLFRAMLLLNISGIIPKRCSQFTLPSIQKYPSYFICRLYTSVAVFQFILLMMLAFGIIFRPEQNVLSTLAQMCFFNAVR